MYAKSKFRSVKKRHIATYFLLLNIELIYIFHSLKNL